MNLNLNNRVALITGGGSGIGAAIAVKLTEEGARVAIVGRNENKLKNVADICEKLGGKPLLIVADITKEDDVKRIVSDTIKFYGKLDILINNAGIGFHTSILDDNVLEGYDRIMATNLRSVVHLTHLAAQHLIESKGNIVNISSIASVNVMNNFFAYSVSKAALDHFTRCIALELAPKGVRVNCINPGPVKTDIFDFTRLDGAGIDGIWENFRRKTALLKIGDAGEIADLVAFIVSERASSMTGTCIVSDNGSILTGLLKNIET